MAEKTRAAILGDNLKRIREQKGVTRKQLAGILGIVEDSIGSYETGKKLAPLDKIFKMADYLGVPITDLIGKNGRTFLVDGVKVVSDFPDLTNEEAADYVGYVRDRVKDTVVEIEVTLCDDGKVDVNYKAKGEPFHRLRRITGYLTSDLHSWNNAKQAEERERVKHGVSNYSFSDRADALEEVVAIKTTPKKSGGNRRLANSLLRT